MTSNSVIKSIFFVIYGFQVCFGQYNRWMTPDRGRYPNYNYAPGSGYRFVDNPEDRIRRNSDERCDIVSVTNLPTARAIETQYGVFEGKIVYLCDTPTFQRKDQRPISQGGANHPRTDYALSAIAYLGIRYAESPADRNRFRDPQPLKPQGNQLATEFGASCMQHFNHTGESKLIPVTSEDCLFLNIYTPNVGPRSGEFAVMIYIHGDEWDHGSGNQFPGHMLAASQDVIVVTFNYRLGALGFLSTGDNSSAGNFGLLDQEAAINWVYYNIHHFGGDRERITLFGPGAGAASAGLHLINHIFHRHLHIKRVIASSGSPLADWAVIDDIFFVRNVSQIYGAAVGCFATNSWHLVECLRRKGNSSAEFSLASIKPLRGWLPFGPSLDRYTRQIPVVKRSPLNELENYLPIPERLREVSYMTGVNRNDASFLVRRDPWFERYGYSMTRDEFNYKIREYARTYNYTVNREAVIDALRFMYTPWADPNNSSLLMEEYVNMLTDSLYVAPMDRFAKLLLQLRIPVYMYVLNYSLTTQPFNDPELWNAVPHQLEDLMVAGAPFMDPKFFPADRADSLRRAVWSDSDRNMSQFFMEAWANFAKYGNPTPEALFGRIVWEPMSLKTLQYLSINATYYEIYNASSFMFRDYRQKEAQFWNDYLPNMVGREPPVWPPFELPWEYDNRVYRTSLAFVSVLAIIFMILAIIGFCCYCRMSGVSKGSEESIGSGSEDEYSVTKDLPPTLNVAAFQSDAATTPEEFNGTNKLARVRLLPRDTQV